MDPLGRSQAALIDSGPPEHRVPEDRQMGLVRAVAKAVLTRVARVVEKNHLFEKPGERQHQPKLPHDEDSEEPGPGTRAVDLEALKAALAPRSRPLLVHHWATWCDPCEEELPLVEQLAQELDGRLELVGVSWDRFQDFGRLQDTVDAVRGFSDAKGLSWPSLVVDADPEALFEALELDFRKVPQTRVIGPDGGLLLRVDGVLSAQDLDNIRGLVA